MRNLLNSILFSLLICSTCYAPVIEPMRGQILPLGSQSTRGLVGYWPMNEGTGNKINDLSGNKNTGTFLGDPEWIGGKFGHCLDFDGTGDYIDCGGKSILKPDSFTVMGWVKVITITETMPFVSWHATLYPSLHLNAYGNSKPLMYLDNTGYRYFVTEAYNVIVDGNWHFITFTCENNIPDTGRLYVDEIEYAKDLEDLTTPGDPKGNLIITKGLNVCSTIIIDHILIYNRALSAAEVRQLYQRGGDPLNMNAVQLWHYYVVTPSGQVIFININ